jgi:hypothetical protein
MRHYDLVFSIGSIMIALASGWPSPITRTIKPDGKTGTQQSQPIFREVQSRRSLLKHVIGPSLAVTLCSLSSSIAKAEGLLTPITGTSSISTLPINQDHQDGNRVPLDNRPKAPVQALVPAASQWLLLDECLSIATRLSKGSADNLNENDVLRLKELLEPPPSDTRTNKKDQLKAKQNSKRLSGLAVRGSMNVYTANLRFGESYALTASPEIKKQMIREDKLPDVKAVITADLDLRDLYRNQIWMHTLIEDAHAELYSGTPDYTELEDLLKEAFAAFQKWFDWSAPADVEEAVRILATQ